MADYQAFKYYGQNFGENYELKNAVFKIKTAKSFSDLEQALTINYFSQLQVYDDTYAAQFNRFKRGYLQRALGQGVRYVETFGILQVRKFKPAEPGSKVCLEIPNNVSERSETIGAITRTYCSSKQPDILDAYDLFVDPSELVEFVSNKIGNIRQSMSLWFDLTFSYILALDPWGDTHADRFNTFTISNILGAKWDDTALTVFGEDKTGVGAILKDLKEDLKKEINKETQLKNVNEYNVWDWCPKFLPANTPAEMKVTDQNKKYSKPSAAVDQAKAKKLYYDRSKVDPLLCAVSVCRCLAYHIEMMTGETTAQNDSMWPGNLEDKKHEYGKNEADAADLSACPQKGSGLRADTKSLYLPIKLPSEQLVIIMNSEMYKEIKNAMLVASGTETGAYNAYIQAFMKWDDKIIKIDTMPYGAFKIGSSLRYNLWDLYDKIETDKLGQADVVVHTGHKGIVFGIRQFRPFKYIRLHGLYVNPNVYDTNLDFKAGQALN